MPMLIKCEKAYRIEDLFYIHQPAADEVYFSIYIYVYQLIYISLMTYMYMKFYTHTYEISVSFN